MAITKEKKKDILQKLTDALKEASSVAFVRFSGLSVADTFAMRRAMREEGVHYYVAKKTLIRRALADRGYAGTIPDMPGEIAIAWGGEDSTAPARLVYAQGKKKKDTLTLVGGIFEDAFIDAEKMQAIATIPPLPVLRGMFVNVINAPVQGLVMALDQIRQSKTEA